MEDKRRTIAAFDFDGTLTNRDTLPLFIIHAKGWWQFIRGLVWLSPLLCGYLLGIVPNGKAKQKLFAHFFKDMPYKDFCLYGQTFYNRIEECLNSKGIRLLEQHIKQGHTVYIISASIEEWIAPWAIRHGVHRVIATIVEVDEDRKLTGRFLTPNCNGKEKVRRLSELEPDRMDYYLHVYGDSQGDTPLLNFADKGVMLE